MIWAPLHSRKILSIDRISTGFCDNLFFSYITTELNPNRSLILSSRVILFRVQMKIGLISIIELEY